MTASGSHLRKITLAGVVGNILEWYDVTRYLMALSGVSLVAAIFIPQAARESRP